MKNLTAIFKVTMTLVLLLLTVQSGFSQKNLITVTPIKSTFDKFDLRYERVLGERLSISAKVQFWFVEKKKREKGAWLFRAPARIEKNKGQRYSLNLRFAIIDKVKKAHSFKWYIAGELFRGKHHITKRREAYSHTTIGILRPSVTVGEGAKHGELDLVSSGVAAGVGWQFIFGKHVVLDFGILAGSANINKDLREMRLKAERPEDDDDYARFDRKIKGVFLEPHLSMGVAF